MALGPSPPDEGGEDVQEAKQDRARFARGGSAKLEFEKVKASEALNRGTASDRVVASALARRGAPRPSAMFRGTEIEARWPLLVRWPGTYSSMTL